LPPCTPRRACGPRSVGARAAAAMQGGGSEQVSSSDGWSHDEGQHPAGVAGRAGNEQRGGKVPPLRMKLDPLRGGPGGQAASDSGSDFDDGDSDGSGVAAAAAGRAAARRRLEVSDPLDAPPVTARGGRREERHDDDDRVHPSLLERPVNGVARELAGGEPDGQPEHHAAMPQAANRARIVGSAPDLRRRASEDSYGPGGSEGGGQPESMEEGQEHDDSGHRDGGLRYLSCSWRETLAHHPGLLERYPLAATSMAERSPTSDDQQQQASGEETQQPEHVYAQWEGNENHEYLNGRPSRRNSATLPQEAEAEGHRTAVSPTGSSMASAGAVGRPMPDAATAAPHAPHSAPAKGWHIGTPHSAPPGGGYDQPCASAHRPPRDAAWAVYGGASGDRGRHQRWPSDVEAAWAEIDEAHSRLSIREREVEQREAAVKRAEARNRATARQLAELRRRLDEYGQELEDGAASLMAQQHALREERWQQKADLRARVHRGFAAGDARKAWTPMST